MTRQRLRPTGPIRLAAAVFASALFAAPPASSQEPAFTIADLDALQGATDDGVWYGFTLGGVHHLANAVNPQAYRTYGFGASDRTFTLEADVEILESGPGTQVGLYCCDQADGGPIIIYMMDASGTLSVARANLDAGAMETAYTESNRFDGGPRARLEITETANGIAMTVNGESAGSYENESFSPGKVGLIFIGQGVFALHDLNIYIDSTTGPQAADKGISQEPPSGG